MHKTIGELTIDPSRDQAKLERFIEEILDYHNIPGEYFGNILLSVMEAAELIGKQYATTEMVTIDVNRFPRGIAFRMRIASQRREIDRPDELDLALTLAALKRETFIIRSLADGVEIGESGDSIALTFFISGISFERFIARSDSLRKYLFHKERVADVNES